MKRWFIRGLVLCAVLLLNSELPAEQNPGSVGAPSTDAGGNSVRIEKGQVPPLTSKEVILPPAAAPPLETLKKQYDAKERQSLDLANLVRKLEASQPLDKLQIDQLKGQLRQLVAEAFAIRQQVQQAELAEFQQRLQRTQQLLDRNGKMQEQIINRRVEDLLNPALKWDSVEGEPGATLPPVGPGESNGGRAALPPATSKTPSTSSESAVDTETLRRLIGLAEANRDRVRRLFDSGQVPSSALNEAEQNLVASNLRLAEATANWGEALVQADLLVKLGQQAVHEAKVKFESGLADGSELFRAEKTLLEAQAKRRSVAAQASAATDDPPTSNNSRPGLTPPTGPAPQAPRNEGDSKSLSIPGAKSPSEYARLIGELRETISELEEKIPQFRDSPEKSEMRGKLNVAKLQYETLTLEFRRLLDLAKAEFTAAENEQLRVRAEEERLTQLQKKGYVGGSEIVALRGRMDQAALRLIQTRSMLELFSQTDNILFPKPTTMLSPVPVKEGTNDPEKLAVQLWETIGLKVSPVTISPGRYRGGLHLNEVRPGSPAAAGGLRAQDVLVGLDKWETQAPHHVAFVLSSVDRTPGQPLELRFTILRNGKMMQGGFSLPAP